MIPSRNSVVDSASAAGAVPPGRGDVQARARLEHVADDQPDDEGERRHDDEVEQRQPADLADLRRLADRPDAEHDRAEDDRADHHLDQVDEPGADRLERLPDAPAPGCRRRCRGRPRRSRRRRGSGCDHAARAACWVVAESDMSPTPSRGPTILAVLRNESATRGSMLCRVAQVTVVFIVSTGRWVDHAARPQGAERRRPRRPEPACGSSETCYVVLVRVRPWRAERGAPSSRRRWPTRPPLPRSRRSSPSARRPSARRSRPAR